MRFMGGIGKFTGDAFQYTARGDAGNLAHAQAGVYGFDFSVIFRAVFIVPARVSRP